MRIRCNYCMNECNEDELVIDNVDLGLEKCPVCDRGDCLMDLEEKGK